MVLAQAYPRRSRLRGCGTIADLKAEEKRIKARLRRAKQAMDPAEVRLFAREMAEKLEGES
jgi:hypothetical protein